MQQLTDRTAVITGAGSGIGRATSIALAQRGCRLALCDIDGVGLAETARRITMLGRPVSTHVVDVADRARMEQLVDDVLAAHGAVHVLVNNAGVSVKGSFGEQSLEDFAWLMGINFWGVVYGCKLFLPHLLRAPEAHIVNISSVFGLVGVPQQSSYCASKFAVRGFTESLRAELAQTRVGVTSVHPGGVATNIVENMRVPPGPDAARDNARLAKVFKKMLPPEVAAEAIVRGIVLDKPRVLITRETYVADLIKRLVPDLSTDLVAWGYERYVAKRLGQ